MRTRTLREGSVGLLVFASIALFIGLIAWLRGWSYGQRSYRLLVDLESAVGMQTGTAVSYRGVTVGEITQITPGSDTVEVEIAINQGDLRIPARSVVKTSQSGLIGETAISIQPPESTTLTANLPGPTSPECNSELIFCDGDRIDGVVGANYEDLLESSQQISEVLSDPEILQDVQEILANSRRISNNVISLTEEVTLIAKETRSELRPLTASSRETLEAVASAAAQIESSTQSSSAQLDQTLTRVNGLLASNQDNLTVTLDNVRATSGQLRLTADRLAPVLRDGTLVSDLEQLAANAALASQDFQEISSALNTTENLVLLQQTIESARDVFQSAQKIMADLDSLTGDPELRNDVRNLLDGLSSLVSSTQDLEHQTQVAQQLESLATQSAATPRLRFNGERYVTELGTDLARQPEP